MKGVWGVIAASVLTVWVACGRTEGAEAAGGLAATYAGDVGIDKDPAVLFHDDFESGGPGERWDSVSGPLYVETETDAKVARGRQSARFVVKKDRNTDAGLWKRIPAQEELYLRCYVRYGRDFGFLHHGGSGYCATATPDRFGPGGHAGRAPAGDAFFWNTFEPVGRPGGGVAPPGALMFYAYWWKMQPDGRGNYWGNLFKPDPPQVPPLETWTETEWRVKANSPGQPDGELDCWVNGVKCGEFRGINWRSDGKLKVNQVLLSLYLEWSDYARYGEAADSRTVWYDDVVVATSHIGPRVEPPGTGSGQ
jgi:hypothetical protein